MMAFSCCISESFGRILLSWLRAKWDMGPKESPEVGSRRKAKLRQRNPDQKPVALGDKEKADDVDQERPQTEVF